MRNPGKKTVVILSDYDDISNGMAYPLGHYIYIWTQPFKKYTTGRMRWLRRVITHEYAHIVTFWAMRNRLGTPWELLGLGFMPIWFIEGVAQYEAERWDDHRELLLRVANSDAQLLSRAKIEGYIGADQIDSRLVYEQGHSLVRYIAARFGQEKIAAILQTHRKLPISFNWSVKRALGVSEKTLYRDWHKQISDELKSEFDSKERVADFGTCINSDLQGNYGVRWSPDAKKAAIVGVESFEEPISRLYLKTGTNGKLKRISGPGIGSYFGWSPDSRFIVYSKARRGKHFSYVNDLFIVDVETGDVQMLTQNLRATDPVWSHDGTEIAFCVHQGAMSNLAVLNVHSRQIRSLTDFSPWTEAYSPSWRADDSEIAISYIDSTGQRDIAAVSRDGLRFRKLTDDPADARTPAWSPDGRRIAYISYSNEKPDLYLMNTDGSQKIQMTDVAGGLFNPSWTTDGNSISVVAFEERDQIDIFSLPASRRAQNPPIANSNTDSLPDWRVALPPHPVPEFFPGTRLHGNISKSNESAKSYRSMLHIRSQLFFPNADYDEAGVQLGVYNFLADPLNMHALTWSVTHRKQTHYFLNYTNRQFWPTINLFASQYSYDRGTFFSQKLWEQVRSIHGQISFPLNMGRSLLANHRFGLQIAFQHYSNLHPENFQFLPDDLLPFEGWINSIGLSYVYSNIHPSIYYDIHPNAAFVFSAYGNQGTKLLKSAFTFTQSSVAATFRFNLIRNHRLAIRAGSFVYNGEQRYQSRYALGNGMIRGLESSIEGDRMLFSNVEWRFRIVNDLGLKIWVFYLEGIYGAPFLDFGTVWGHVLARDYRANRFVWMKNDFDNREFVSTGGGELRGRLYLAGKYAIVLRGGMGWRLNGDLRESNSYFLIGPVF